MTTLTTTRLAISKPVTYGADMRAITARLSWEHDSVTGVTVATFHQSTHGGRVILELFGTNGGKRAQVYVDSDVSERCGGTLSADYVRRFYGR